jgi:hypothetical protein
VAQPDRLREVEAGWGRGTASLAAARHGGRNGGAARRVGRATARHRRPLGLSERLRTARTGAERFCCQVGPLHISCTHVSGGNTIAAAPSGRSMRTVECAVTLTRARSGPLTPTIRRTRFRCGDATVVAPTLQASQCFGGACSQRTRSSSPESCALAPRRLPPGRAAGAGAAVRHRDAAARRVRECRGRREPRGCVPRPHRRRAEHAARPGERHQLPRRPVHSGGARRRARRAGPAIASRRACRR